MTFCNSDFIDNGATSITPGIYIQSGSVLASNITIDSFNEVPTMEIGTEAVIQQRVLQGDENLEDSDSSLTIDTEFRTLEITSGFFFLTVDSSVEVTDNSVIKETGGSIANAFYLQIGCSLIVKNSTMYSNGYLAEGSLIVADRSSITIEDCLFYDNYGIIISSLSSPVTIINSNFTSGNGDSYIDVSDSSITIDARSNLYNNSNPEGQGLGLNCK